MLALFDIGSSKAEHVSPVVRPISVRIRGRKNPSRRLLENVPVVTAYRHENFKFL